MRGNTGFPDVTLELSKALSYSNFLQEELNRLPVSDQGQYLLAKDQGDTFGWILCDIGSIIHSIDKALYPDEPQAEKIGNTGSSTKTKDLSAELHEILSRLALQVDAGNKLADMLNDSVETYGISTLFKNIFAEIGTIRDRIDTLELACG